MNGAFSVRKLAVLLLIFAGSCHTTKKPKAVQENQQSTSEKTAQNQPVIGGKDSLLSHLLASHPQYFEPLIARPEKYNIQILYTQVDRGANQSVKLTHHSYNLNPDRYFYPASTVKLPVAILALQRLNELSGAGIDRNTTMVTEGGYKGLTAVYNDPTTPNGKPSIAHYIKKILLVSDNDAYNRLYEFLGQEYINSELQKRGYRRAQIVHRLEVSLSEDENRTSNPVKFLDGQGKILYQQELTRSRMAYAKRNEKLGKGYYKSGLLVNEPMDFSQKNRLVLEELHNILLSIVYPEAVPKQQRFAITETDRIFLMQYMSQLPQETNWPPYRFQQDEYWPSYCKFVMFGSEKGPWPENIRIFNKVGDAYGHLLDAAYVVDFKQGIEFFVSAIIYCNEDGILNDNKYEYDQVGLPFMKNLGRILYEYESKREKANFPDFSSLRFAYD